MTLKSTLNALPVALVILLLGACTTTDSSTPTTADAPVEAAQSQSAEQVAENLARTKSTATSDDGEIICKREPVVGSKFNRKVCATKDQWAARRNEDRKTTERIQRSAGPGVTN